MQKTMRKCYNLLRGVTPVGSSRQKSWSCLFVEGVSWLCAHAAEGQPSRKEPWAWFCLAGIPEGPGLAQTRLCHHGCLK